jgi:outer membrane protein assembly factor BamB
MKCHDNRHTSLSPYNTGHVTGVEKWRFLTYNNVEGGITIGEDGIIYFGSWDYHLYAVYPDGNLKWKYKTDEWIWSSPAIAEDGTIYVTSYDDNIHAVNPDGTVKWKTDLGSSISTSPAIDSNGIIYAGTMSDTGQMCAVYPNGTIKWKYNTGWSITSDPAISNDGTIYFGSMDDYVYALNPNGTLKWKYETGHYVKGPPSIADDGTVYIGSWDDYLYAFYPTNGTVKWRLEIESGFEVNPSIGPDGTIYVSAFSVYAINPDGTIKWTFPFLEDTEFTHQSSIAISADGILYVGTLSGSGGQNGGRIYAINSDGTLRWRKLISNDYIQSSPAIGKDGTIYIGSTNDNYYYGWVGYLHAFNEVTSNTPPYPPEYVGSPRKWWILSNEYHFVGYDPDNNPIQFYIKWGNGKTRWTREYASGEKTDETRLYLRPGRHTIKIKARDVMGAESDWTTVVVRVPYMYNPSGRFPILSRLIEFLDGIINQKNSSN